MLRRIFADPLEKRIQRLEQEILKLLDEVGCLQDGDGVFVWQPLRKWIDEPEDPHYTRLLRTVDRLRSNWPVEDLAPVAADMYFNPVRWQRRYPSDDLRTVMLHILEVCLVKFPPPDIYVRLEARLRQILEHPYDSPESKEETRLSYPPDLYLSPKLADLLELLMALPASSENVELVEKIVLGEMDFGPFDISVHFKGFKPVRSYRIYDQALTSRSDHLMERLFIRGRLGYEAFRQSVYHLPDVLYTASLRHRFDGSITYFHKEISPDFGDVVLKYCDRLAWEIAQVLTEENYQILKRIRGLHGSRYLLQAAHRHSALGLGKLVYSGSEWREGLDTAIIHLAQANDIEPASPDERQQLLNQLKTFPAATLKYLLPVARHARQILCEALGWEQVLPLIEIIARTARMDEIHHSWEGDVQNSPDPSAGVLDVAAVKGALAQAGDILGREVLSLFYQAKVNADNTVHLIQAVAGWNRSWVEKGLPRRNQTAIRAFGLLPIERGESEVLERYLFLQNFSRESKQFGPQRQTNERAAAQAALANLAQTAGYANATRLEWAMEALLAQEVAPAGRTWNVDDYQIEVALNDMAPQITVRKGERSLKSVPPTIRESAAYAEAKEAVAHLRDQLSRFRATLEDLMSIGEALSRDDLASLVRLPVARVLLGRLVLHIGEGILGLLDADALSVQTLDGTPLPIQQPVRVAHPYHFYQAGQLAAWQQEIVRRRLVQPFKQVFRELYLLTPAEQETGWYSNRFAGHVVDSRVASRLFQARGWQMETGDWTLPCKPFPKFGQQAFFEFPDAGHFLAETDTITSDRIYFKPYPLPPGSWQQAEEDRIALEQVSPLLFSEVMRDADLVVSVGQRGGEEQLSGEAYQRRGELIKALLEDLGISGVSIEGHFAYVQGRLARYRVHLGSATIHIEPGNYLCIVPDRWGQRHERLFLPFADAGDEKLSEVISKILLLTNDHKIKDETILSQIRRRV